ncbi:MAG TPA: LUD domain-containing protein [Cyclobacteriaceae bacterium]|nr:LUD domain-containing protein [Cyclobacteriaceae bacterium]
MNSRQAILDAIARNKPQATDLPVLLSFSDDEDLVSKYTQSVTLNGGTAIEVESLSDIHTYIEENFLDGLQVVSLIDEIPGSIALSSISDPHELESVELAVVKGEFGAVENAAIWVSDKNLTHRVLPFIAQHLIIVLEKTNLVPNMHEAYRKINVSETGYGVFIAGPSKTADIEQSLVIGAHGARSLTVFLI